MEQLLRLLHSHKSPVQIPVLPEKYSTYDGCFYNVQDKVSIDRGQTIYGWKLHKTKFIAEAERHAVWKSPKGELIDITPDRTEAKSILFIEDDNQNWTYNGEFSDNIRVNLTDNPLVNDIILLSETVTKLWQTGKRISRNEVQIDKPIHDVINFLEEDKKERLKFMSAGQTVENNCYCGRLEKYKDCHGLDLKGVYDEIFKRIMKN